MKINMNELVDVRPHDRVVLLRNRNPGNDSGVRGLIFATQLTDDEYEMFLKDYLKWIVNQEEKVMLWEAQEYSKETGYYFSKDKMDRILKSRGNLVGDDLIKDIEKEIASAKEFIKNKGYDYESYKSKMQKP
jgi:hypothetical protein